MTFSARVAICMCITGSLWAAGTVTQTLIRLGDPAAPSDSYELTFSWTADAADGTVPATVLQQVGTGPGGDPPTLNGLYLVKVQTNPGSTAPTDNYDIVITDVDGIDVMSGNCANRDTAASETCYPPNLTPVFGALTLSLTGNSVNGATGVIRIFLVKTRAMAVAIGAVASGGGGGGAPLDATYITRLANASLTAETDLAALATGCLGSTTVTGVLDARILTGTAGEITVANGNCAGDPTFALASALSLGAKTMAFGTDPADTGIIRAANDQSICWETSPASTDLCLKVNPTNEFEFNGPIILVGPLLGPLTMTEIAAPGAPGTANEHNIYLGLDGVLYHHENAGNALPFLDANSITVGQVPRITGTRTYGWGALNLANPDAVTGLLGAGNVTSAVNAQTGTTYTYLDSDRAKLVTHTNASAIAGTLPDPAGAGFDAGWYVDIQNRGAGTLTLTPLAPATIDGATSLGLTTGQGVRVWSDGAVYFTQRGIGGGGGVSGSGVADRLTYWSGPTTITSSANMTIDLTPCIIVGPLTSGYSGICGDGSGNPSYRYYVNGTLRAFYQWLESSSVLGFGSVSTVRMALDPATGRVAEYNDEATAGVGHPYIKGIYAPGTITDSVVTANLVTAAAAGAYRISSSVVTTAVQAACDLDVEIGWTFNATPHTFQVIVNHDLTVDETPGFGDPLIISVDAGTAITRTLTDNCVASTWNAVPVIVAERLN